MKELKLKFLRNAVEEILRRSFNTEKEAETITTTLLDYLVEDHKDFVENLFERKKAQILKDIGEVTNPDSLAEIFNKMQADVNKIKEKLHYPV